MFLPSSWPRPAVIPSSSWPRLLASSCRRPGLDARHRGGHRLVPHPDPQAPRQGTEEERTEIVPCVAGARCERGHCRLHLVHARRPSHPPQPPAPGSAAAGAHLARAAASSAPPPVPLRPPLLAPVPHAPPAAVPIASTQERIAPGTRPHAGARQFPLEVQGVPRISDCHSPSPPPPSACPQPAARSRVALPTTFAPTRQRVLGRHPQARATPSCTRAGPFAASLRAPSIFAPAQRLPPTHA